MGIYRIGARIERLPKLPRLILRVVHRPVYWFVRNFYGIEVPVQVQVGRRLQIGHQSGIVIHEQSVIGDDCIIRHNVTLGVRGPERLGAPILGNRVDIGCGAVIVGPVRIGDGAVIGSNAVVLCDVPPGATAVRVPARVIPPKNPVKLV